MILTDLYIYPVKSLAGIRVESAAVALRGLQYDRRWMVVDAAGRFMSQREFPAMALIGTAIEPSALVLFDRRRPDDRIRVPLDIQESLLPKKKVRVWSSQLQALPAGAEADAWLSAHLGAPVQLVGMTEHSKRAADGRYAPKGHYVSFADGFPFLLIGAASLEALNARLDAPVSMDRFRPNFVFSGGQAFEEEGWADFWIGQQPFRGVKPCARCVVTTIDQHTAETGKEPLRTLAQFRRKDHKVIFGQNVVWMGQEKDARVAVGDTLRVAL
jgi:uncharacterized protein YcbX